MIGQIPESRVSKLQRFSIFRVNCRLVLTTARFLHISVRPTRYSSRWLQQRSMNAAPSFRASRALCSNPRQHSSLDPTTRIIPKAAATHNYSNSSGSIVHLIARVPLVDEGVTRVCVVVSRADAARNAPRRTLRHERTTWTTSSVRSMLMRSKSSGN